MCTARDKTKALVLVRRCRLVQTRRIINPFPVIVRMEKNQPRIQNQVSIFILVKLLIRLAISAFERWTMEFRRLFSLFRSFETFYFFTIHVHNISLFLTGFSSVQQLSHTGTDEFVSVSIHFFSWVYMRGTGLKINSDWPDFVSVADPTRVTFVPVWDCTVLM